MWGGHLHVIVTPTKYLVFCQTDQLTSSDQSYNNTIQFDSSEYYIIRFCKLKNNLIM